MLRSWLAGWRGMARVSMGDRNHVYSVPLHGKYSFLESVARCDLTASEHTPLYIQCESCMEDPHLFQHLERKMGNAPS